MSDLQVTDSEASPPAVVRSVRRHRRPRRLAILVIGLVFLFTPTVAYLSGVRATEFENRPLAPFPSLSEGWGFFPAVTTWATDHLPLREVAVSTNARVSREVFGEVPARTTPRDVAAGPVAPVAPGTGSGGQRSRSFPPVFEGKDGWLFLGSDQQAACEPGAELGQTLAGVERLGELLTDAGKDFVFTVAPDKSTTSPDRLPDAYVGDDCAPPSKVAFWEQVQDGPVTGYVDLKAPIERAQEQLGTEIYRPSDTHWGPRGALIFGEQVARALDPELWRTSVPTATAPVRLEGDLSVLLGVPRQDEVPGWELRREGVVTQEVSVTRLAGTTTGAPLWAPPTLILGDSFTRASLPQIAPLFADARIVEPGLAARDAGAVLAAILAADAVVLQLVERTVAAGELPLTDPAFLTELERALASGG